MASLTRCMKLPLRQQASRTFHSLASLRAADSQQQQRNFEPTDSGGPRVQSPNDPLAPSPAPDAVIDSKMGGGKSISQIREEGAVVAAGPVSGVRPLSLYCLLVLVVVLRLTGANRLLKRCILDRYGSFDLRL